MEKNAFLNVAHRATTLSELMAGREQIKTDDVISKYPDGITIIGFDIVNASNGSYPIVIFKEDSSKFLNGGSILSNICEGWAQLCDGDISAASAALESAGGVKVQLEHSRTKSGNNITLVRVIG